MAFWGLVLEPKKSYSQKEVEHPFHISTAALDVSSADNGDVSVLCRKGDSDFILCSLSKKHGIYNAQLNLDFELGAEINFHVQGNGSVHLTGYMIEDMESFEDSDESGEEEEEEDGPNVLLKNTKKQLEAAMKRKQLGGLQSKSKKSKVEGGDEDDDEEDDSDFDMDDSDAEEEGVEEEEDEDDDEDEDEDDEPAAPPKDQGKNKQKQQPKNQQAANASKQAPKQVQNQGKNQQQQSNKAANGAQSQTNGVKKQVINGVQIEDLKVGNGPVAKGGKSVGVYYVGRLKSNNKQFDATTSGAPFKFRLGRGEVIKGWDVGVAGMKVGGKRRLTIPPKMAYGERGAGGDIPPNAALVFEVELKNVK